MVGFELRVGKCAREEAVGGEGRLKAQIERLQH
jgi:hypothetical protein